MRCLVQPIGFAHLVNLAHVAPLVHGLAELKELTLLLLLNSVTRFNEVRLVE